MRSSEYSDEEYRPFLEITYEHNYAKNYYLKDHLGNIRVTLDDSGDVIGYNDYYPFGQTMPQRSMNNALSSDIYKYSGKELDEENGLDWYYFGARYYDPEVARWMQVDPLADKAYDMTPYHYTHNNPINRFDPDGRQDWRSLARFVLKQGLKSVGIKVIERHTEGGAEREIIHDKNGNGYWYMGNDKDGNPIFTDGRGNIYTEAGAETGTPLVEFNDTDDMVPDIIVIEPETEEQEQNIDVEKEEQQKEDEKRNEEQNEQESNKDEEDS